MTSNRTTTANPLLWNRRQLLQTAGVGFGSLAFHHLLQRDGLLASETPDTNLQNPLAAKNPHIPAKAKSVIFLFAYGGPSHVDLLDPKPALEKWQGKSIPVFRKEDPFGKTTTATAFPSPYRFAKHGQSGIEVSEMFPQIATVVDELCVIRSMHCESNNHAPALFQMNTGFILPGRPSMGAWATYGLGSEADSLPAFVVMWDHRGGPVGGAQGWTSGFLPAAYQGTPFRSQGEPIIDLNLPSNIHPEQQNARLRLLKSLNERHLSDNSGDAELASRIFSYELAYRMQMAVPEVMQFDSETKSTQSGYGLDNNTTRTFGQQCLAARRMVERGVRFVQIFHGSNGGAGRWDGHSNLQKGHGRNCLETDQPIAALIKDLKSRGMLDSTLIVWHAEFGRMPISQRGVGRDHNPGAMTGWMAGAGIQGGQVIGASDDFGYKAEQQPVSAHDLHATMLHLLGMDHKKLTYRYNGRDMRLTDVEGVPIPQIIA